MHHPGLSLPSYRAPYMAAVMAEEPVSEEWEVVQIAHSTISIKHIKAWRRLVQGTLTIQILRGFWAHLGHYLKEVKRRGITSGLPQGHNLSN